jgi:hypothetical protein
MKSSLLKALIVLAAMFASACTIPCETQTFRFGGYTIEYPIDVRAILQKYHEGSLDAKYLNSGLLIDTQRDTTLLMHFNLAYKKDQFAPDGEDADIVNKKGVNVTDTLGKGIYNYCFLLPNAAYDSTLRYLEQTYGTKYDRRMEQYSKVPYYVWELSDCTKLIFASVAYQLSDGLYKEGEKVTFVSFAYRLTEREIAHSVGYLGDMGEPFYFD